ncbi:MAG: choice-of-anchor D domain-containing protein [Myxococcota bacterium]
MLVGAVAFTGCGPEDGNNGNNANNGADTGIDGGDVEMDTEQDTQDDVEDDTDVDPGDPAALSIAPGLQEYGTVTVGESSSASSFTVTNDGEQDSSEIGVEIEGAASGDFAIDADDCDGAALAGGESCTIDVLFSPTASGDLTADLAVTATDGGEVTATLEGTGAEPGALSLSPTPVDFGTVIVDQNSDATEFTVENTGGSSSGELSVTLSGGSSTAFDITDDGCSNTSLDADGSCAISVEFAPASTGAKSTTLIVSNDADDLEATAQLSGTSVEDADLSLAPLSQDFGSVVTDDSSTSVSFTVSNDGGVDSGTLAVDVTGTDAAAFIKGADACDTQTLAPGDECTVALTFEPTTSGSKTATLEIAGTPGGTVTANLTGEGLEPGALTITPTLADFGSATVNTVGSTETFTVENTGGAATGTLTTAISGSNAADFSPVNGGDGCQGISLGAGATCTISIVFEPNATGSRTASLTVSDTSGGSISASLSGEGLAVQQPADIALTPSAQDFGSVPIDTDSTIVTFQVENLGDETSGTPNIGLTGTNFNQFNVVSDTCSGGLNGGDTCTIDVRFEPTSTGAKSAVLEVEASPGGTDTSQLQGTGTDTDFSVAGASSINWTGADGEEPEVINGGTSAPVTVTLENKSTATATTGPIDLDPSGNLSSSPFTIVNDSCSSATLAPGANCTFEVEFSPTTVGDGQSATLDIEASPGGAMSVALQGNSLPEFTFVQPTDDPFAFPDTPLGDAVSQQFEIQNTAGVGSQDRDLDAEITGTNSGQFSTDVNGLSGTACDGTNTITAGDSCYVNVVFEPTGTPGTFAADLDVTDGTVTKSVGLEGTGLGPIQLDDDAVTTTPDPTVVGDTGAATFRVVNTSDSNASGRLAVDFTGNEQFSITTDNCDGQTLDPYDGSVGGGDDECTIEVIFFPTAEGTFTADLSVAEDGGQTIQGTVTGNSIEDSNVELTSGNGDFSTRIFGATDTATFTLTNNGTDDSATLGASTVTNDAETVFALANNGDGCDTEVLAANESCDVTVALDTNVVSDTGSYTGTLSLPVVGDVDLSVEVRSALSITPDPGQFGSVVVGESSTTPVDFDVTNDSGSTVTISTTTLNGDFTIVGTNECSGDLASGATCSLSVSFSPDDVGDDYNANDGFAKLTIAGAATGDADDAVADLEAETLQVAQLEYSVVPNLEFGYAVVGETGATRTFTVQNTGEDDTQQLSISSGNTDDWNVSGGTCDGAILQPSDTCDFDVTFAPDTNADTTIDSSSDIQVTDGNESTTAQTVEGKPIEDTDLRVSPSEHTYNDTLVGNTDVTSFTITNTGGAATDGAVSVTLGGSGYASNDSTQFTISNNGCPTSPLQPNASCTVEVTFAPDSPTTSDETQDFSAGLTVEDSGDATDSTRSTLFGSATSNTSPTAAAPGTVDIGDVGVQDTMERTFQLDNAGDNASGGVSLSITGGTNQGWFSVASNGCSSGIPALGSCDIVVDFTPQAVASADATLEVDVTGATNPTDVTLTGNGVEAANLVWSNTRDWLASNDNELVATTTDTKYWILKNDGTADTGEVAIDLGSDPNFELGPDGQGPASGVTPCIGSNGDGIILAAGETCAVPVVFKPQSVGSFPLSLEASASPGGTVTTTVEGDSIPTLSADPASYDACIETGNMDAQTFQIANIGPDSSGPLTVEFTGSDEFYLSSSSCSGATLSTSGQSSTCDVAVTFAPTTAGTGKTATLTVRDIADTAGNDEVTVSLTGEGSANCPD